MSGSRSYSTSDASEPERSEVVLSLATVHKMLPLVKRIATDIIGSHRALIALQPEEEKLDRQKRNLDWPQRQRRYQIKDELSKADHAMQEALLELQELGLVLQEEAIGRIGFPTLVNNRRAFFSWHPGEESLQQWQFADEDALRPIPATWLQEIRAVANS